MRNRKEEAYKILRNIGENEPQLFYYAISYIMEYGMAVMNKEWKKDDIEQYSRRHPNADALTNVLKLCRFLIDTRGIDAALIINYIANAKTE